MSATVRGGAPPPSARDAPNLVHDPEDPASGTIGLLAHDLRDQAINFCLPDVNGKTHCLKDYASAGVLVVIFTCDHCPMAQLCETKAEQLVNHFKGRISRSI